MRCLQDMPVCIMDVSTSMPLSRGAPQPTSREPGRAQWGSVGRASAESLCETAPPSSSDSYTALSPGPAGSSGAVVVPRNPPVLVASPVGCQACSLWIDSGAGRGIGLGWKSQDRSRPSSGATSTEARRPMTNSAGAVEEGATARKPRARGELPPWRRP